jgi:fructose-1,6-bisphosphatase I
MSTYEHEIPPLSAEMESVMTLEQFIIDQQERFPHSTGAFSRLIRDLSVAAKIINRNIQRAGILDVVGEAGNVNVQGETQKKLDVIADNELVRALRKGGEVCLIGSEEQEEPTVIRQRGEARERYAIFFDPLDGSSNTDVNASVGTIFSVYNLPSDYDPDDVLSAALQPGSQQLAAGYVAYGSSTMLVYTTGDGVNGFTLDPSIGEFLLSHPDLTIPDTPKIYSVNEADVEDFSPELRAYLRWLKRKNPETGKRVRARYIGSFVSDFHRNLLTGGIYIYPQTPDSPSGKLRLMYEANPMAFIVEQAGGKASTGHEPIMDVVPEHLHQRVPLFIGSPSLVDAAEAFLSGERDGKADE